MSDQNQDGDGIQPESNPYDASHDVEYDHEPADAVPPAELKTRQPAGLWVLFITEMWERFSYYGMRALLILYLTKHFMFGDKEAGLLYGSYAALVYAMPVIGGLIADRYLGFRRSTLLGAWLLVPARHGVRHQRRHCVVKPAVVAPAFGGRLAAVVLREAQALGVSIAGGLASHK